MMTEQGAMDSGIGELMQGISGDVEMEGPMDEGVGSLMAAGAGNTPPVNFRHGGSVAVRGYQGTEPNTSEVKPGGGVAVGPGDLTPYFEQAMLARKNILGTDAERAASLEEDREMAKAQMLFDIAGTALNFAGNTQGNTIAERLANAASQTQLTDKIGSRSAGILQSKKDQKSQDQQLALQALASAEQRFQSDRDRDAQIGLLNVKAANEMNAQLASQTYDSAENVLNRDARVTLAEKQIEAQKALQKSGSGYTIAEQKAQAELRLEAQKSMNKFTKSLQNDRFDATRLENSTDRAHKVFLEGRRQENIIKLEALRFDNSKESLELQDTYRKENLSIQAQTSLDNQLELMGATNAYNIGRDATGQRNAMALQKSAAAISVISREDQQAHDFATQAARLAAQSQSQITAFSIQKKLQDLRQNFQGSEAEKARAYDKAFKMIDNAFKTDQLAISQGQLDLGKATLALDQVYKLGKLEVDKAAANAVKMGSESQTNQIKFISDKTRLDAYAAGTLEQGAKDAYELAVLNYVKQVPVFNKLLGYNEGIGAELTPTILKQIKKGSPEFYKKLVPVEPAKEGVFSDADGELTEVPYLNKATKEIMFKDGTVNLNSPVWEKTRTSIFDPKVNYTVPIGFSRVPTSIQKAFLEGTAELSGKQMQSIPSVENLTKARTSLDMFATELLQFKTNLAEQRVLLFVQQAIERNVENIRPGGWFLKTDADALATLNALSDSFAKGIVEVTERLPEYGGRTGTTQARKEADLKTVSDLKIILNEVLAFKRGFETPNTESTAVIPVSKNAVAATIDFLNNNQVKTKKGD